MAGPDPRRSSRARTSQPLSWPSSTASSVSGRPDRSSNPFSKSASPKKTTSTTSRASEPPDDAAATTDDSPPPQPRSRRATHTHNTIKDDSQEPASVVASEIEMLNDGDDIQEDDEAVRCICGAEDYPGPPSADILQQAAKDGFDVDSIFPTVVTEDLAGFFVQCDICKVWQHGACVGLVNDDTLPEDYYCEWCRKDFHRIFSSSNGPRCSIYQPSSRRRSRTGSFAKERDRSPKMRENSKDNKDVRDKDGRDGKSGRATSVTQSTKRRSTMNSRDAAYDEEQLRIAIEASKEDAHIESVEGSSRRSKRSRSFSEEKADGVKRQRTSSRSASPTGDKSNEDDSDDATTTRNGSTKKARNAAAIRSQQQRERAEKEERERQRAEAANKRNGRAERRRADGMEATRASAKDSETHSSIDSDPSEEIPLAARSAANRPSTAQTPGGPAAAATGGGTSSSSTATAIVSSAFTAATMTSSTVATPRAGPPRTSQQPSPETPPPLSSTPMSASKSKGGRPTHKKKGRNQYTKEREVREEQQARSRSRDVADGPGKSGPGGNNKSGSRAKGGMSSRVTMTEMKRRVSAMFDFISKTQVELAGEESDTAAPPSSSEGLSNGHAHASEGRCSTATTNGDKGSRSPVKKSSSTGDLGEAQKAFTELSCLEMMDFLTRDIVHWQGQFAN